MFLHPAVGIKDQLESRTVVRVRGTRMDEDMVFDGTRSLLGAKDVRGGIDVLAQPGNPPVLGEQKLVVLLVNFQDTPIPLSPTKTDIEGFLANQLAPYYAENSYNKISITGNVFGWYTIPLDKTCDIDTVGKKAIDAADSDVFFPDYSRLIVIAPYGCVWGGRSSIGKVTISTSDGSVNMSKSSINSPFGTDLRVVAHELGHGFGNGHAGFLDCGDVTITFSSLGCLFSEYGDPYDTMGSIPPAFHFNALHKEYLGWFDSTNIQTVTASGTYVLEPIETSTPGLKALKIERGSLSGDFARVPSYLYIEYRQPLGFDAVNSQSSNVYDGALLHIIYSTPSQSLLLDPTPLDDMKAIALTPGLSFIDPGINTKITAISATPTALTPICFLRNETVHSRIWT